MKTKLTPAIAAVALSLAASPLYAVTVQLAAKAYTKTMPDGSTVPMWGYVLDTGGCWALQPNPSLARQACIEGLPDDPEAQGPRLNLGPALTGGASTLVVQLSNGLPDPTSLVITGQKLPNVNVVGAGGVISGPTWDDGSTGNRANANQRVRSFVAEAPANGGRAAYRWNIPNDTLIANPGSFIYHSGTWPQKQVYMGLSGLLTKDAPAGEAYPGVPYDNEVVLFYSDIDPVFNAAVAAGTLETAVDRHPTWFLVNGEPYEAGVTPTIGAGNAGENTLLRLASTATDTHVVVLQGLNMAIHAEDGEQYNYQEGANITPAPRVQYSAMLPPAKTKDAIVVAPLAGDYAVYDGDGYMTNPSDPANEAVGDEVGGMLRFLAFGAGVNQAPTANPDAASVVEGFSVGINVLGNDTDPESDPLSINSHDATAGLSCSLSPGGTCTYDATGVTPGTVTFNYVATDGTNLSNSALVTITVDPNLAPTANDDTATTDTGVPVIIDVAANDTDPEGQPLTVSTFDAGGTPLGGSIACAGTSCTYTGAVAGNDTFTYTVTDGPNVSNSATVTVTVVAPNVPPIARNDPPSNPAAPDTFSTGINTQLTGINVLWNDADPDGPNNALEISTYDATGTEGGTVTCVTDVPRGNRNNPDATCTYTPATDFVGDDTFTYTITDGVDTDSATVTITVTGAGAPVLYFSTSGAGTVPGTAGPYDGADVYTVDAGDIFSRLYDAFDDLGLPNNANIDGISVNGTDIYVSFAASSTAVPGIGDVPDEDVVVYDTTGGTWSAYFDGSLCGLDANNGQDIDAVSVSGGTLYFSTLGGGNNNPVGGVAGPYDDADVYSWNGGTTGTANCARELNATNGPGPNIGLPGNADIDGLTVVGTTYHMSFNRNEGTAVPTLGTVQDEAVVSYDSGTGGWSVYRANAELNATNSQDVDAIHVP